MSIVKNRLLSGNSSIEMEINNHNESFELSNQHHEE